MDSCLGKYLAWRLNFGCGSQAQDTAFTALHASQDAVNAFIATEAHPAQPSQSGTNAASNDNGAQLPLSGMEVSDLGLPLSDKTRNQLKDA